MNKNKLYLHKHYKKLYYIEDVTFYNSIDSRCTAKALNPEGLKEFELLAGRFFVGEIPKNFIEMPDTPLIRKLYGS